MTTYSLDCCDCHGNRLSEGLPMGPRRTRIFDPATDPRLQTRLDLPHEKTICNGHLTHLRYGDAYEPTKEDVKNAKKSSYKALQKWDKMFIMADTVVMQVAVVTRGGDSVAARFFAEKSQYNRTGLPGRTASSSLAASIDIGMQTCQDLAKQNPVFNRFIVMTSSDEVIDAANKIWDWTEHGFPDSLPEGLTREDCYLLHHNISNLEKLNDGIEVQFWKVGQEYLPGAVFDCNCRFDDLNNVPLPAAGDACRCWKCTVAEQHRELSFAKTGKEPCPCPPCRELVMKYGALKKGETFPLTNNAGVYAKVVMEVNGCKVKKVVDVKDADVAGGFKKLKLGSGEEDGM